MTDTHSDDGDRDDCDGREAPEATPATKAEAETEAAHYRSLARRDPAGLREHRDRLVELLAPGEAPPADRSTGSTTDGEATNADRERRSGVDPEERRAASAALAALAAVDPGSLAGHLPTLLRELRRAADDPSGTDGDVVEALLRCVGLVVADDPERVADVPVGSLPAAMEAGLDDETLRVGARALFAAAGVRPAPLAAAVDVLGRLIAGSDRESGDPAVRAWSAGALGRLAATHPDAVAGVADALRSLLDDDDPAVRHNAVEALGALVRERPAAVAPAVDDLRAALRTGSVAVRHNAAAVLAHLAGSHPGAVVDAVPELRALRDHGNDDLRRIATAALARLASAHPDLDDR